MNIEEIKEFTKNKEAWYHVIVPKHRLKKIKGDK
jgi:hypothetical protein